MRRAFWILITGLLGPGLGAQDIFEAVRSGDPKDVDRALAAGASLQALETLGVEEKTPLMVAADQMDVKMALHLLKKGAKVNFFTPYGGKTILMYLVSMSEDYEKTSGEILEAVIKAGAQMNLQDSYGYTALAWGVWEGRSPGLVARLLKAGADHKIQNHQSESPLYIAVAAGNHEMAEVLLKAGASPAQLKKENKFFTPMLHEAVSRSDQKMVELLLKYKADINIRSAGGWGGMTALHKAVENRDVDMVRFLVGRGAHVNARDDGGSSPMDYAIQGGGEELAEIQEILHQAGGR